MEWKLPLYRVLRISMWLSQFRKERISGKSEKTRTVGLSSKPTNSTEQVTKRLYLKWETSHMISPNFWSILEKSSGLKKVDGASSLFPTFYLPEEYAEKSKKEREWRNANGAKSPGICTRVGGGFGGGKRGKSTVYTVSNASHPYQGGKCSPKWDKGSISKAGGPFCKNLLTSEKICYKIQTRVL